MFSDKYGLTPFFQASSDMFLEIMRDIEKEQKDSDCFLEQAKILVISHDISFTDVSTLGTEGAATIMNACFLLSFLFLFHPTIFLCGAKPCLGYTRDSQIFLTSNFLIRVRGKGQSASKIRGFLELYRLGDHTQGC